MLKPIAKQNMLVAFESLLQMKATQFEQKEKEMLKHPKSLIKRYAGKVIKETQLEKFLNLLSKFDLDKSNFNAKLKTRKIDFK